MTTERVKITALARSTSFYSTNAHIVQYIQSKQDEDRRKKKQYIFSLICYLYKFWKRILLNWKNKHIKKEKMTMEKTNEVAVLYGILIQISKEKGITRCVCNYSISSWQIYGKKLIYCKYEKLHSSEKYVFCTFNRNSKHILLNNALQNFQIKIVLNHETCSEAFQADMKPKSPTVM